MNLRIVVLLIFLAVLFGCSKEGGVESAEYYPMLKYDIKRNLRLVTYDNSPVYASVTRLEGLDVKEEHIPVFVSESSQLLFEDGSPVVDREGYLVFWAKNGEFINTDYRVIDKGDLFIVNGKRLENTTALMLRELWKDKGREF